MKAKPTQRSQSKGQKEAIKEATSVELSMLTLQLPKSLHLEFKSVTSKEGAKMKEVLIEFIEEYVKKKSK